VEYNLVTTDARLILVVDDDSEIRKIICETLELNGHTAIPAGNCGHAIKIFEEKQKQIALLITDIVMPRFSGRDLAKMLSRQCPSLQVLFISGYTYCKAEDDPPNSRFLHKPFKAHALLDEVKIMLAQ